MEVLVKSVRKTADVSKLFSTIFERIYDGLYIWYYLWLQHISIKSNDYTRWSLYAIALLRLKRALKSPIKNVLNVYESTYHSGPFTDILVHSAV